MHHNILPDDINQGGFLESMDKSELINALKQFPQLEGARVMVHSSLSSFGYVEGGALTVIEALQAAITPHGTLMMPSFNHGAAFEPGAAGYYDPLETPTINGAIPDLFWRLPGIQRSLHPTHAFAAWGRDNSRYVQNHHRTLTMGPDSPLGLLCRDGGFALLLGVGYASNTFQHVVEVSTGAPCLGLRTQVYPVRLPGDRIVQARAWSWRQADCPLTDRSLYAGAMHSLGLQHTAGCKQSLQR